MPASTFSGGSTTRLIDVEQLVAANFKITDVDPRTNEWQAPDGGKVIYYKVSFEGQTGEVSIGRKEGNPPKVGDEVFGVIEDTPRGLKFKTVKPGGGGGNWGPKKDDPDQRRSIERQVSAKIAAELVLGGKAELKDFRTLTDRVHAAIEGKAE